MTAITDKPLSEKDDAEIAVLRERTPIEGDGQHSLIELEWQKRLMKVQKDFNEALMLKQHELNKEIMKKQISTMKAAIIATLVGAIVGAILTTYLPKLELLWKPQAQSTKPQQGILPTTESTVLETSAPRNETDKIATPKENVSSKPPPKVKHE